ncbi:DUF11 domain-containing protein [Photobacterium angustum]|uniref:DUF11 domain-containing protein n=1 Tax=Photobacterium angustum TaxID=661 RepID=UPI000D1676D4|nr:DUF11 domain-containing protein [Photobacterium angustum]PSV68702.1 hypothetical protein CTM95_03945 [Photobacterium angustum]
MLPAQANITDDLVVKISAPKNYDAGSSVKYTLTIKNNSEDTTYKNIKLNAAIADITTMLDSGEEGNAFSSVSNSVDTIGNNSDAGVFNTSGNLVSKNIVVAPSESITYIITANTVENAIGDINTSDHVSFKKGFWFKKELDAVVTRYLQPELSITKTVANTAYQTGKKITYTVVVENAAHAGTARNYHVIDTLSSIQSQAANNNIDDNSNWSHIDEDKSSPFTSWDIIVAVENGADSSLSSPLKDADLDDTVTLPAKGKITYTVTATTTAVAIAEISNKALLLDAKKQQVAETALVNTNTQLVNTTENTKRVIESEYSPGDEITYVLRVTNKDKHKFANNISLLDKLMTCPTTTQSTGADEAPFEYWYIDSIDAENTAKGTDAGVAANNPSAHRTDNINFVVDLAPNSYIEYTIKAKVKDTTIGHIQDSNACGDDFDESGSGIDMPKGKIQIKKSVDQDKFTPGEDITYTIEVKNPSNGLLLDIPVVDKLNEITAENADGKKVYPFTDIHVTTEQGPHSNPDVNGDLNKNPIDVKATIFPNESVKYIVTAMTKQDIVGVISNTAYAGEGTQQGKSTVITMPRLENLKIEKHVKGANRDGWRAYGYKDDEFTYTIKVTNPSPAGFAKNVTVTDAISQIKAELLEKAGEEVPVFTSWTVSTDTDGGAEVVTAPENNEDLESVINVPADGSVTFIVTAQIDPRRKDHVVWGKFTNQAQAELARTGDVIKTTHVDVVPAEPRIRLRKLVSTETYTVDQPLDYTIDIENYERNGYVNDGHVTDSISSLGIFDSWKIWWEVIDDDKNSSTTDRGQGTELFGFPNSESSAVNGTKDLDRARFDLAPHQTLRIHVKGIVSHNAIGKGIITNVATVDDNSGEHFDASVDVKEDGVTGNSVSIYKYGDPDFKRYHPGDKYTWTVHVVNNSAHQVDHVIVSDQISGLDIALANNGDNHDADTTGTPYRSWKITKQIGSGSYQAFDTNVDLSDHISLKAKGEDGDSVTYQITAIIKDNVVDDWLQNVAKVTYRSPKNGRMEEITAYADASVQRASTGGNITRHLSESHYIPGKTEIVYTVTASSNLGYMNNKAILENLEGLKVKTINKDGTTSEGNPFDHGSGPEFTVDVIKKESKKTHDAPSTSTDGKVDGTVADNKNIDTVIDVAPGEKVIYTVTGKIREDAVGDITFNNDSDLVVEPYEPKLEITKQTQEKSYKPGQQLTYLLTVENTGKAHAFNVHVKDLIADIKVIDINGIEVTAFSNIRISDEYAGDYKDWFYPGSYDPYSSLDTTDTIIPLGGKAVYTVKATVNKDAVGSITNALDVNGNTTEVVTNPVTGKFEAKKTILAYYDDEKNKLPNLKGYMPGGYIEYEVTVTNKSEANIDDLSIKDDLSAITSKTFDGKDNEPVFDEVLIESSIVHKDTFTRVAGFDSSDLDLNTSVDIGALNTVTFNIKAHIKPNIVGTFQNEANIGERIKPKSPVSHMLPSDIELVKTALDSDGKEISTYAPGQSIQYKIELINTGYGTSYNTVLKDELSKLVTNVAELSGDGKQDPEATPFKAWSVNVPITEGGITTLPVTTGEQDIKSKAVIAPKSGKITILVDATISDDALGDITNTAVFGKKSDVAVLTPESKDISASKNVIELDGKPFTSNSYYLPGQKATYEIKVQNSSNNWANDITVKDVVSHVNVDVAGDKNEPAYSDYRITYRVEGGVSGLPDTFVPVNTPLDNKQLDTELDIAPQQTVYFTVEAMIKDTAVGVIEANHAFVNGLDNSSQEIPPQSSGFIIDKKVADEDKTFMPGQEINYTITVENTGDAWLNDLPIKDEITTILADIAHDATSPTEGVAFISISVEAKASDGSFVTNKVANNIDAVADIKPKGSVTFTVTAVVADNVIGPIDNTAYAGSSNPLSDTVTIVPIEGEFTIEKAVNKPTFVPSDIMTYTLTLENKSEAWVTDVKVTDAIDAIEADVAGGKQGSAFDKSSIKVTSGKVIVGDGFVEKNPDGSISALVDLAPNSKAEITIQAKVAADVVGDITNTAMANDTASNEVVITPEATEITIEKTADISEFVLGQTVNYTVTVNNTKASWATSVNIKDEVSKIEAEIAGGTPTSPSTGSAFDANSVVTKIADLGDSKLVKQESNESIVLDIAPNASVVVNIAANVNKNVIGSITNIAHAIDTNGDDHNAEVTIEPIEGAVVLTKEAMNPTYQNGGEVGFDIKVENTGAGFAAHVELQDLISKIEATTNLGQSTPALTHWKVSYIAGDENTKVMDVALNKLKQHLPEDKDVNVVMDIAPQDTVTFTVMGTAADDIVDDITNIASMTFGENKQDATATVKPEQTSFEASKASTETHYIINKDLSFELSITNTSNNIINDMVVNDDMSGIKVKYRDGSIGPAFAKDSNKFVVETVPQGAEVQAQTETQFLVDLPPKQTVTFRVTGTVVDWANGALQNIATVNDQDVPSNFVTPLQPEIKGTIVTTTDYDANNTGDDEFIYVPGGTVVYTITLENNTDAFANNVGFMSEFSKVNTADYSGRQIPAYTDWKIVTKATGTERGTTVGSYTDGKDVQTGLHIAPHSKVVYTFTTTVDKNLVNVIDYAAFYLDNKAIVKATPRNINIGKLASTVKPMLPEYDLKLTKTASKATAQVGDVVEYEVIVENDNKANFYDVSVVDHYPAGFQYVEGSTQIVHSGSDGEFDTPDDEPLSQEPAISGQLTFRKVNLKSNEKVRVRYLMRVSTGVTFGKYVNTAVAQIRGEDKSNTDKATVEVEADKLFDTASIIGKVFEDLNGDGFQADATAKGITVKTDFPKGDYVANSTTLMRDGKTTVVSDVKQAAPISSAITVKTLMGQSQNRTLKQGNKAVLRFKTTTATPFAFSVTTSNGTHVHFGTDGKITRTLTGDTKQGLSAENLNVTRNLYQAKTGYVWEIVIENVGIYEDGIPGVRLITTEGIKIETDQFGRYHIPDQWVKDNKGKNFLVKVDTDSLPTGMKVISENPKVQRITPHALAKFNFSVQTKH